MSPHFLMSYLSLQLFTFCLLFKYSGGSVNPKFEACQPKNCGNGENISFPFYIEGKQELFCGFPGFTLSCENGFPMLNLSETSYIVQEIFYTNQSLRVSNPAFSNFNSSNCLSAPTDLTLYGHKLNFAQKQKELFLFFNCTVPEGVEEYRIGCSAGNKTSSVLAMDDKDENLTDARKNCTGGMVKTMVEEGYRSGGEEIGEALRRGFVLNWTVTECSQCEMSGGKCGFDMETYSFRCFCRDRDHLRKCNSETTRKTVLVKITVGSSAGVAMLLFLAWCFKRKLFSTAYGFFWRKNHPTNQIIEAFLKQHGPLPTRRYSYSEIKEATNCFKIKLGQGGYGSVYKGKLQDGCLVAVKILSELKGTGEEFINEVASISRTSHVNIVNLLGFCFQGSKKALVYEFMSNGSLEKFIYEENINMVDRQLDCKTFYDIAIGVARGLEYLHRGCNTRILHFDIKPHNILLDEDFCPKISDFGLAKICPRKESIVSLLDARGTAGYIAPEVFSRIFGGVSHKSDVYSYGMMVLEMVGGRRNINVDVDRSSELYFPHWIYKRIELNQELGLRCIKNESDKEIMKKMTIVSLWCIQTDPATRPAMNIVVEMLEGSLESLQVPPKPYLSSPSRSPTHYSTQTCENL